MNLRDASIEDTGGALNEGGFSGPWRSVEQINSAVRNSKLFVPGHSLGLHETLEVPHECLDGLFWELQGIHGSFFD